MSSVATGPLNEAEKKCTEVAQEKDEANAFTFMFDWTMTPGKWQVGPLCKTDNSWTNFQVFFPLETPVFSVAFMMGLICFREQMSDDTQSFLIVWRTEILFNWHKSS